MEELKKLPIEREEINFENRLKIFEPKKKFKTRDIVIGLILIAILIGVSIAATYYLPQNSPVNLRYYQQGQIDIYKDFVSQLGECKQVPVVLLNNQTANAILVECLQQGS